MDAKISMIISDICVKKNRFIITDDNMVHSESLLLFVNFRQDKALLLQQKSHHVPVRSVYHCIFRRFH